MRITSGTNAQSFRTIIVLALTLCVTSAGSAQEAEPAYRVVARFEERILKSFGPFENPAALIVGKSTPEATVLMLRNMKVVKRVPMGREGNMTVGASANGRYVALVERADGGEKPWWQDPDAKWRLTLQDRKESKVLSRIPLPNPVKEVQVSDDGKSLLVLDAMYAEPPRDGSIRMLDAEGKLLGELPHYRSEGWSVFHCQMTRDGSKVFVTKRRFDEVRERHAFACLDRKLEELWSRELDTPSGAEFTLDEDRDRLVVCATGRESCGLVDLAGKTLWPFNNRVGGESHFALFSADGKSLLIRGGYEVELIDLEARKSLWVTKPPAGLAMYFAISADVSPDGQRVIVSWRQRIPARKESMKAPRYVVLYDREGRTILNKEFPGDDYTSFAAPEVRFSRDGKSVIVREEKSYGIISLERDAAVRPPEVD